MAKTNWQDPQTSEIRSTQVTGLQDAVKKIEDAIDISTVAETGISLTEVYISAEDRYRIYQAPAGKRNWLASPAPVIKKNGGTISSGFTIDYGGGAIIVSPAALVTDVFTADVTYTKGEMAAQYSSPISVTQSITSLPATVTKGQLSVGLKGNTDINIVREGNFPDTSEWTANGCTLSALGNVLTVTGDGTTSTPQVYSTTTNTTNAVGKKIYVRALVRVTNASSSLLTLRLRGSTSGAIIITTQASPVSNTWYLLSGIVTLDAGLVGNIQISVFASYADAATANGKVMEVKEVMAIDLTSRFGAGFEPSLADCNLRYPNWFDTTKSTLGGRAKSVGKNLFDPEELLANEEVSKTTYDGRECFTWVGDATALNITILEDKFKSNTQYVIKCDTARPVTNGDILYFEYTDGSLEIIRADTLSWATKTVVSDAGKTIKKIRGTNSSGQIFYFDFNVTQIEEGTTATTYEPYTSTEVIYPDVGNSLPNGTKDEVSVVNGQWVKTQRVGVDTTVLKAATTWGVYYELTNTIAFRKNLQSTLGYYTPSGNSVVAGVSLIIDGLSFPATSVNTITATDSEEIGISSDNYIWVRINKSRLSGITSVDLETYLQAAASVSLIYQLATPVVTEIEGMGELIAEPNGTIIITPAKKMVLEGSLGWVFHVDASGYKAARYVFNTPEAIMYTDRITKYNGISISSVTSFTAADQAILGNTTIHISIADSDSGWGEAFTPSTDEIQAYFYGWKMNNGTFGTAYNGTGTKTWARRSATSNDESVTVVPAMRADGEGLYVLEYETKTEESTIPTLEFSYPINLKAAVEGNTDMIASLSKSLQNVWLYLIGEV